MYCMPRKKQNIKKKIRAMIASTKRDDMISDGAYDGRFRQRSIPNGKVYKKPKHKDNGEGDE